jgi:succinyl-diaminopimelate desuccinylase
VTARASDLLEATARLVDIASVSRNEGAIADHVESVLRGHDHLDVVRIEHNVVARTALGHPSRVVLAGHLDTVPPAGNARASITGNRLSGVGSADMKGGLAVMLALAGELVDPGVDLTFVFYACEEISRSESGLRCIEGVRPDLLDGDVAIVLEPTNGVIEAGCQGVVRVSVTMRGKSAHSSRPWVGSNAIHRLGQVISRVASYDERMPVIDGVTYHETVQAVAVEGGIAGNVIPNAASVVLSHRFAPDRDEHEALEWLRGFLAPILDESVGDAIEVIELAPSAAPNLNHPMIARLREASGSDPVAKTAWTDVAFFAERGVPAVNFGPGDPLNAHSAEEFVEADEIERVAVALRSLLS